ncbi:MAG: hypothetical protein PHS82_16265 [Lachnospiraceae bacterium]|nr:hypothetical protein [Lachnospiraceae bacterium]
MKKHKEETGSKEKKKLFQRKKKKSDQIVRIEELEKILGEDADKADLEAVVSMYMPHRRMKNFASALLRLDKLYLWLLGAILLIAILFITAFMQEKMGNFTINLNRLELFRKGVSIASDGEFTDATARLSANTVADATNISVEDLPEDLDNLDGEHNGKNYMAYTYYIRNAGKEDLSYIANVTLDSYAKGAEEAVRVAVWKNGERTIYAEPAADGSNEPGCENFVSHDVVCSFTEDDFAVGYVNKYTIVIWLEGDDPECVDSIVGGSVEFSMNIDSDDDDETNLFVKFIQDIKDTLFGDKPISAAGNDAPDYYKDEDITWENRGNK